MKLLVTSVSTGHGHVKAAQAIEESMRIVAPFVQVKNIDVKPYLSPKFQSLYVHGYDFVVNNAPSVWGALYNLTNSRTTTTNRQKILNSIQSNFSLGLIDYILNYKPDRILSTHFLIPQIINTFQHRHRVTCPIDVVVTDYKFHQFWFNDIVDRYYVGNDDVGSDLIRRGVPSKRIHVTGIPVRPIFLKNTLKDEPLLKLGLDPMKKTLLVMFGGSGMGPTIKILQEIFKLSLPLQIITVSGRNQMMLKKLNRVRCPSHMTTCHLGYVNNVHELMVASDLLISKSGGLTLAESLAVGIPMIVFSPIPGQEEKNAEFLEQNKAGIQVKSLIRLAEVIAQYFTHPRELQLLRIRAKSLGRPNAAEEITQSVLSSLSLSR